ncbi:hypothetical protein P872_07735 [Rhodonellum psychrophilum GCM71 = DSM 17998]|uniref:Uncharacterized protein n=1 Tax=Rhodonellum psychrophilum GCM71 = DSM 17998 TaxID=1123057 RepID=U5BVA3_9BACT|nr:hypothetical protein P872_07735 [Rhodonellum psychrophilum GCM71 = DSM 17998]
MFQSIKAILNHYFMSKKMVCYKKLKIKAEKTEGSPD